ncbi:hypothetical protein SteCoe_39485 [Stentor coeruleus]|uniref:Uncharacterized protein n=1 Tax=Stentor coeruleus TaxID=5963 RepID=A0A1R2AKN7_9CILI|nr:hypothetical protein SteCoe_39485 [Stentor coeruleus]
MEDHEMKISRSSDKDWKKDSKTQDLTRETKKQAFKEQNRLSFREEMGKDAEAVCEYLSGKYPGAVGFWLNYMSNTPREEMYAFVRVKLVIDIGIKVMGVLARYRLDEGYELFDEIDREHKVSSMAKTLQLIKRGLAERLDGHIKYLLAVKKIVLEFVDDLIEVIVIRGINEYKSDYSFMLWAKDAIEIQYKASSYCRDVIRLYMLKNGICETEGTIISLSSINKPILGISGVHEESKEHAVYENLQKPMLYPSLLSETILKHSLNKQVKDDDTASESEGNLKCDEKSLNKPRRCMGREKAKCKRMEKTRKPFIKLRDLIPIVSTCKAGSKPKVANYKEGCEGMEGNKFVDRVVHKRVEQGYEMFYKYPWKADKAEKVVLGERGFSRSC